MQQSFIPAGSPDMLSISDQVYTHIKKLILAGTLRGGERIPEKKVADQFKVSRTPVREAIRKLAENGLVVIKPRSYAFVATISPEEARNIAWVRLYLEKLSVRLFCAADPDAGAALPQLHDLSRRCGEAVEGGDFAAAHEHDSALHLEIARRTGNAELVEMLLAVDAKLRLPRLRQNLSRPELARNFAQHDVLLKLLEKKDLAKLETLLEEHFLHDRSPRQARETRRLGMVPVD
jgi:DNA-binding GntR family transcriptional regulator